MKSFYRTLLAFGLMLAGQTAPAQQIQITPDTAYTGNGELRLSFRIEAAGLNIRARQSIVVEPVIANDTQRTVLSQVIFTSRQRARFDRRAELLGPSDAGYIPYQTFKPVDSRKRYTTDYRMSLPYQSWMDSASVHVRTWSYGCGSPVLTGGSTVFTQVTGSPAAPAVAAEPETWRHDPSHIRRMVLFVAPQAETVKNRSESVTAHINFKRGDYRVYPDFGNNPRELQVVDTLVRNVTGNDLILLNTIRITGYASPEGTWAANERLAMNRSNGFRDYVSSNYGLPSSLFRTDWVAEDWDGLVRLIEQRGPSYKDAVVSIISSTDIFDGREKKLMLLQGGTPYRQMLETLFPQLRRIELRADYVVLPVPTERLREILDTRPALLSLEEIYRVAAECTPGTAEYLRVYETAARYFPGDTVAMNNAASAAILCGDLTSARYYLDRIKDAPVSFVGQGVVCYAAEDYDGAAAWFRKAAEAGIGQGSRNLELMNAKSR